MRVTLLGANGQLGSVIHNYLRQHYPEVQLTACVRQMQDTAYRSDYKIFHPFRDDWQQLGPTDVLINCIGIIKESKHYTFDQAHNGLTRLILQHRQAIGNPKIIQISALGADIGSSIRFLSTKGKADELLLMHYRTVVVRPSIVCTLNTMLVQKLKILKKISNYLLNYLPFPEQLLKTYIQPIMPEDFAAAVARLCFTDNHPAIIHVIGPQKISLQEIIKLTTPQIKLLPMNKTLAHIGVRAISAFFPELLSWQQYQLLQSDNIADSKPVEKLLQRATQSTKTFWRKNLEAHS